MTRITITINVERDDEAAVAVLPVVEAVPGDVGVKAVASPPVTWFSDGGATLSELGLTRPASPIEHRRDYQIVLDNVVLGEGSLTDLQALIAKRTAPFVQEAG